MLKTAHAAGDTRASRLAALRKRHEEIESKIDAARTHHRSISDFYLVELKKQKLHVKELIEELVGHLRESGDVMRA